MTTTNESAETSQRLDARRLELVEAVGRLVAPMDEILAEHQKLLDLVSQELRAVRRLLLLTAGLAVLMVGGYGWIIYQQAQILRETIAQRELIEQKLRTTPADLKKDVDAVKTQIDQQPRVRVRPAPSSDPTAQPVVVIDTPSPSDSPGAPSERVEIPVELPAPSGPAKAMPKRR